LFRFATFSAALRRAGILLAEALDVQRFPPLGRRKYLSRNTRVDRPPRWHSAFLVIAYSNRVQDSSFTDLVP